MEYSGILEQLGLSSRESQIYLYLLNNGASTIAAMAKEAGLHRPIVYQILPGLIERGLISKVIQGKRTKYSAESPDKLKAMIEELRLNFENALPDLDQIYRNKKNRPLVKFLEGRKGIMAVFDDIVDSLKKDDVFYRYSSRKASTPGEKYLSPYYREKRDEKQLQRFVITNEAVSKEKKQRLERAVKVVPDKYGLFDYNIVQLIYGDKIAFVDYSTETAFIVENAMIAEFQRKLFKILYDKL